MDTIEESIYDHPQYYDLIFGSDCAAELRFIERCQERMLKGAKTRLFEPACGTGRLIYRLARRGQRCDGLDLNARAVEFCNQRLQRYKLPGRVWVADMTAFEVDRPYDLAFNTINSFRHLLTEESARRHLECMSAAIRPGGIYLLGLHLTPTDCEPTADQERWSARRGHLQINTYMRPAKHEPRRRLERFAIDFDLYTPSRQWRISDVLQLRSYTAKQFQSLVDSVPTWSIESTYDFCYRLDRPMEVDGCSEDVLYLLRRQPD
jgi:SAM-dependent methyltransferase